MSIRYQSDICLRMLVLAALLMGILNLTGCEKDGKPQHSSLDLRGVNLSPEMADPIEEAWKRLHQKEDPELPGVKLITEYQYLNEALRSVDPTTAIDRFFQLWASYPENLLLVDLADFNEGKLKNDPRMKSILALPALSDTNSAVGCYRIGREISTDLSQRHLLFKSLDLRNELDPLQQIWLENRLTIRDRRALRPDDGVRRLLEYLEPARLLGGVRMEFELWSSITVCLVKGNHMDDALHTVALMEALANEIEDPHLQTRVEFRLGKLFEARDDFIQAGVHYQNAVDLGRTHGIIWYWHMSLDCASRVQDRLGNYPERLKLDQTVLALAKASADSLNIPRIMNNIADTYLKMGKIDSFLAYQDSFVDYIALHPIKSNVAYLPFILAEYSAYLGHYDRVDSLLNVAMGYPEHSDLAEKTIMLHIRLIKSAMEQGRPDLVHQSVVQVDSLHNYTLASGGSIKINSEDDLLIAEFFTQQGEFSQAIFHLERASATMAGSNSPEALWNLFRTKGLLARKRGDMQAAMEAFASGHETIRGLDNPELQARSRFLLGSALLEDDQPAKARELFPPDDGHQQFGGRFRTRLASQLFRGMTFSRADDQEEAVRQFQKTLDLCSPWSPQDLVARTHLELGQSLVALKRIPEASDHLHQSWVILENPDHQQDKTGLLDGVFHGDLRRQTLESLISLYLTRPETSPIPDTALASLNLWGHMLRPEQSPASSGAQLKWAPGQLVYFIGNQAGYCWKVTTQGVSVQILPPAKELEHLMSPVLSDLTTAGRSLSMAPANRLSAVLLSGTENVWARDETLHLICDGKLGSLPWAALPLPPSFGVDAGEPLLRRGALIYQLVPLESGNPVPASSPTHDNHRLLAIGANSSDGTDLANLDHAEEEAQAIGALWNSGATTMLLGNNATWKNVKDLELASFGAIHLASHARIFPGLPNQSYLVLSQSQGKEQLTASAVANLDLNAELIYLSSCETANTSSGQTVGTFVRAFLNGGARSVIASSLGVDDEAALYLAERVYTHWQKGIPVSQALRQGQLDLREFDTKWSHPFYWAFFRIYQ